MTLLKELKSNFQKDGTNEWHRGKIISSIIAVLALVAFIIYKNKDLNEKAKDRKEHLRYTIGITGKKYHNYKSSQPTIEYFYKVEQQEYSDREHIGAQFEKSVVGNGGRYYVEFSSINPSNSKLLLDRPVPDSITSSADDGWTFMPGYKDNN
jgi:hypothetical protein